MLNSPYIFAPDEDSIDRENMKRIIFEKKIEVGAPVRLPDGREGVAATITAHFSVMIRPYRGGFWPGALTRLN